MAVGEKARSQGSSSRKSLWAGGGEPQEGPGWALSSGRPPPGAPCLAGPSRAWVASRFVFIFNSLYCSNHLRATENKTVILSRPQFPGLNCLPFANFSF